MTYYHTSPNQFHTHTHILPRRNFERGEWVGALVFMSKSPSVHKSVKTGEHSYTYVVRPTGKVYYGADNNEWYSPSPVEVVCLHHVNRRPCWRKGLLPPSKPPKNHSAPKVGKPMWHKRYQLPVIWQGAGRYFLENDTLKAVDFYSSKYSFVTITAGEVKRLTLRQKGDFYGKPKK